MYRRGIFFRIVLVILLLVVIVAGGAAVYRIGWGQGYLAGTALASSEGVESGLVAPGSVALLYHPFYPGFGFPFLGVCFGLGFIFLIMFLVGGLLRPWRRRGWAGYPHHGKWAGGPMPPWAKEWQKHQQDMADDKEATKESDNVESDPDA